MYREEWCMSTSLTPVQFAQEVGRRIGINEGCKATKYRDSLGVWTIGIGYNLERADAVHTMALIGANYNQVMNGMALTYQQIDRLFAICLAPIEAEARNLIVGYDKLSDARRFVIIDMIFNLGAAGFAGFAGTRALIEAGIANADHSKFVAASQHMEMSAWRQQVGNRAERDIHMMADSGWVSAVQTY